MGGALRRGTAAARGMCREGGACRPNVAGLRMFAAAGPEAPERVCAGPRWIGALRRRVPGDERPHGASARLPAASPPTRGRAARSGPLRVRVYFVAAFSKSGTLLEEA